MSGRRCSRAVSAACGTEAAAVLGVEATEALLVASTPPLRSDHLGFFGGDQARRRNSCPVPRPPTYYLIWRCATGAHVPLTWPCAPDRGAGLTDSGSVVGPIRVEINLTVCV
jgi:hypothetical protein